MARAYDAILDARFDEVPELLAATCAPERPDGRDDKAPAEACRMLDALALWWRMRLDVHDRSRDQAFGEKVEAALIAAEAWAAREPARAEAWFYLGASYGARAQWRSLRGEQVAAARDGKRIKEALERAVALDPAMQDARFGLGLYQYYADVAPSGLKLMRWLLLLPGGDRAAGLRAMEQAHTGTGAAQRGRLPAAPRLSLVRADAERALVLARELRARHPHNPALLRGGGRDPRRPPLGSGGQPAGLAQPGRRGGGRSRGAPRCRRGARTTGNGGATGSPRRDRPRHRAAADAAGLARGRAGGHRGSCTGGPGAGHSTAWARAPGPSRNTSRHWRPCRLETRFAARLEAREGLRRGPDAATAEAYRLSLEGWRALERGGLAEAARDLNRALALRPADPATRYRYARLQLAERHIVEGVGALEAVISDPATPPHVFAGACYHAARALEQEGARPRAIELYRLVVGAFGVDPVLKAEAQRALRRLSA